MQERSSRAGCDVPCELTIERETLSVRMTDFHDRGLQLLCDRPLMVGTKVELVIPGCLPVSADVRWALGKRAGCICERPVRGDIIAAAVSAAKA